MNYLLLEFYQCCPLSNSLAYHLNMYHKVLLGLVLLNH
nr:MAG TPA: toxin [Caudoviricetes sp.]